MSITAETAKEHAKDPAVLCCRAEGGITIQAANLEDPAIFDDLVDSGLLKLDGTLTIEQVLGAKLVKTCDSLTPLTADLVEGAKAPAAEEAPAEEAKEEVKEEAPAVTANPTASVQKVGGVLKIHIGEGKDIDIEMPMGFNNGVAVAAKDSGSTGRGRITGRRGFRRSTDKRAGTESRKKRYQKAL